MGGKNVYRLHLNENLFIPRDFISSLVKEAAESADCRLYPEFHSRSLVERLSEIHGIDEQNIFVYNGSESIIHLLARRAARGIGVVVQPTFEVYVWALRAQEADIRSVLLGGEGFELDPAEVADGARGAGIVFMASPNNPTGNQFREEAVLDVIASTEAIVVVDEAYVEYADYHLASRVEEFENLVILRTFSKAWGLAGLRLGYAFAPRDIVEWLVSVSSPVAVSSIAAEVARPLLDRRDEVMKWVGEARATREWMRGELNSISNVKAYRSDANFLFVRLGVSSRRVVEELRARGYKVRNLDGKPLCDNSIRVTVPPRPVADGFIEALEESVEVAGG